MVRPDTPGDLEAPAQRVPSRRRALHALLALGAAALAAWYGIKPPPPGAGDSRPSAPTALPACLGTSQPLRVANHMPYAEVTISGRRGWFVLDYGATLSSITAAGFGAAGAPQPVPGTTDRFDGFEFFGPWGRVQLQPQPFAPTVPGLVQAGVIGTDFLASHVYTLNPVEGQLHRADASAACSDDVLNAAGFVALSTAGYFSNLPATLTCPLAAGGGRCANVPTVPVRIGSVDAIAQIDTGYDDSRHGHSININAALFEKLRQAGVPMVARPDIALVLTTCVGVAENVEAWQLAPGTRFGFVTAAGALLERGGAPVTLFLKRTPPAASVCGGIGTWAQPAAQLGASFVSAGAMVVDPFRSRVWLR